jgi:hypothetical protein
VSSSFQVQDTPFSASNGKEKLKVGWPFTNDSRGARIGGGSSRRNLVSGGVQRVPNHDAAMRIGGEAPGWWVHSTFRHIEAMVMFGCHPLGPFIRLSAYVSRCRNPMVLCRQIIHDTGRRTMPCGITPAVTNCHNAMSSLRASATTMVLRLLPAATHA